MTRFRKKTALCCQMTQKAGRRWLVGRRTPAVATGQCAGTTLARVVRGSAKAGAEMQTARILNVSPPTWRYKSCALFALQSIYLNSECGFGVSAFFADFGGIGVRTQHTYKLICENVRPCPRSAKSANLTFCFVLHTPALSGAFPCISKSVFRRFA